MFRLSISYLLCFSFVALAFSLCQNNSTNNNSVESVNWTKNSIKEDNTNVETNKNNQNDFKLNGDIDPFDLPLIFKIQGSHLKAISIVLEAFKVDSMIPENKKKLENYDIELRQDKDNYYIYFSAKSSEKGNDEERLGGETSLGKSVMFVIGRKDFELKKRYFFM